MNPNSVLVNSFDSYSFRHTIRLLMRLVKPRRARGLTGYVGAGAMVGPVLQKSLFSAHLLRLGVGVPAGLRAVRRTVLRRVVVQLEAFALRSHLPVLISTSVRRWGERERRDGAGSGQMFCFFWAFLLETKRRCSFVSEQII